MNCPAAALVFWWRILHLWQRDDVRYSPQSGRPPAPSVSFADSPLPEGALASKHLLQSAKPRLLHVHYRPSTVSLVPSV